MAASNPLDSATEPVSHRVATGLAKIGQAIKSRAWKVAVERRLTPTQGQILAYLDGHEDTEVGLSAVAEALGITAATASEAVRTLEEKGLVRKRPSATDARAIRLGLSAEGKREAGKGVGWPQFLAEAVGTLSAGEQRALLRGVIKTIRALQERGDIPLVRMCVTCQYFRPYLHDSPDRPHHCAFVDAPFGDRLLRIDCPDHALAAPMERRRNWKVWAGKAK